MHLSIDMEIKMEDGEFYVDTPHGKAFVKYRIEGKNLIIYETFVPPEERHKGIATALTEYVFKFADENKFDIIDECSFTSEYKKKLNKQ